MDKSTENIDIVRRLLCMVSKLIKWINSFLKQYRLEIVIGVILTAISIVFVFVTGGNYNDFIWDITKVFLASFLAILTIWTVFISVQKEKILFKPFSYHYSKMIGKNQEMIFYIEFIIFVMVAFAYIYFIGNSTNLINDKILFIVYICTLIAMILTLLSVVRKTFILYFSLLKCQNDKSFEHFKKIGNYDLSEAYKEILSDMIINGGIEFDFTDYFYMAKYIEPYFKFNNFLCFEDVVKEIMDIADVDNDNDKINVLDNINGKKYIILKFCSVVYESLENINNLAKAKKT